MSAEDVFERLRTFFAADARGAVAVYLFGSIARGTDRADSDVDVGVLFENDPPRSYEGLPLGLEGALEQAVRRPVQVVVLNRAPADLVHRVLRDGRLVLDRDRARRIRFEVQARNEFFDLQPILRRYREPRPAGSRT
jgi:uncharacterized protein